jgi:hypothetical protein
MGVGRGVGIAFLRHRSQSQYRVKGKSIVKVPGTGNCMWPSWNKGARCWLTKVGCWLVKGEDPLHG